jgi:hypothetical protein
MEEEEEGDQLDQYNEGGARAREIPRHYMNNSFLHGRQGRKRKREEEEGSEHEEEEERGRKEEWAVKGEEEEEEGAVGREGEDGLWRLWETMEKKREWRTWQRNGQESKSVPEGIDLLCWAMEQANIIDHMSGNGHRYPDAPSPGGSGIGL